MSAPAVERSTLVGVATGTPDGGVAIVRVSGPQAATMVRGLVGEVPPPRHLVRRRLGLGADIGEAEDALVAFMPGPGSFTGEDVVELHVHAGERNVRAVLEALMAVGGTAAGPGDFSRRAFELGRLSLDQAEGIAALVAAQTDEALVQARRLAAGEVGTKVQNMEEAVAGLRTEVEANLDFPEDVEAADHARWIGELGSLAEAVQGWVSGFETARRARERARVVLAGPPNAGKSSLFNALVGRKRALVAASPGTTRDYIEAELELGRHVAVLVDTAGLRRSDDAVETGGIELSREQLEGADIVLWLEAADARSIEVPDWLRADLRIETKRDLGSLRRDWLGVSVEEGSGLDELRQALTEWFERQDAPAWVGLARHRDRAREALHALVRGRELLEEDAPLEVVAFELAAAQARLGEITGRTRLGPIGEDVLHRIFSSFCIGK